MAVGFRPIIHEAARRQVRFDDLRTLEPESGIDAFVVVQLDVDRIAPAVVFWVIRDLNGREFSRDE